MYPLPPQLGLAQATQLVHLQRFLALEEGLGVKSALRDQSGTAPGQ
jgi:hypothetical protein